jgi:ATP/maltotriose-dependent transcriptional regulator MalT/DNA-binding SARP family transcriptional activator
MPVMPDQHAIRLVDSRGSPSVSFAPPDPAMLGARGRTPTRVPIAVGPGRAVIAAPDPVRVEPRNGVTYPIQPGKIQAPALRDETLARTRLLDWLDVKIHSRVVFVIADAGYGKTTLLADFSRRTRLRTIWYRIDEDDRDWVGFLAHLVSAGREFDPEFAPRTAGILRSLDPGGPTREDAIETFLEELPAIAPDGAALILDDFHLADEVADIRLIARELVARGPERLSIVFASRRPPAVPVAKLRSLGELAELGITDLRFSDAEMEQLFRETYGRPLEPDVLTELAQRTEGWAASLTLVQAALRERTPAETRSFVRSLSGARDELHDYLAEEVVGELPEIQQQFLMRTAILQRVTPELAQVATGLSAIEVQSMVTEAERLGMLGRRSNRRSTEQRYHPLVREFLEDRLERALGTAGVDDLHVAVARWAEPLDWRTAAHHFAASKRWPDLRRVLETHLETIVASGAFSAAAEFVRQFPEQPSSAAIEVVLSRLASVEGDIERVTAHAERAAAIDPSNDAVIGNLLTSKLLSGRLEGALEMAEAFALSAQSPLMRDIGRATAIVIKSSIDFDLATAVAMFVELAERCHADGLAHYEGVSWLNAALTCRVRGLIADSYTYASRAVDALSTSSSGNELASALFAKGTALALGGDLAACRALYFTAGSTLSHGSRSEFLVELADIECLVGDHEEATRLIDEMGDSVSSSHVAIASAATIMLEMRRANWREAADRALSIRLATPTPHAGHQSRIRAMRAVALSLVDAPGAVDEARDAVAFADRQHAGLWREVATLALASRSRHLSRAIAALPLSLQCVLSISAELVVSQLDSLDAAATRLVRDEAELRPQRWLLELRRQAADAGSKARMPAARLLNDIGAAQDVVLLRSIARESRQSGSDRQLGKALARNLAPLVHVEDLGRVSIRIGSVTVAGGSIRRKVLALLCYLLTRPRFSANREEVMDAMWPDMDPAAAVNSLNQSVYFLRRVFEPEYSEDTTAGYVHQDSDVLWLDMDLISSQSSGCAALLSQLDRSQDAELVRSLSNQYVGRFALDFAYEDWSVDFRDWLHVAYLRAIEGQIKKDIDAGDFDAGVAITRRALEIDARQEDLELSLFRLLRNSGAHSAAAEQFARYANVLRGDLGVEPPSVDSV